MARISFRTRSGRRSGPVGRVIASLFFLVFLVAGLVITWAVAQEAWSNFLTHRWPETTCTIVASSVSEDPAADSYAFSVTYRYQAAGRSHTGYVYRPGYTGSDDPGDAYRLAERYPAGAAVPCRVHPDDPTRSTLEPGNLWSALVIFLPLIFVAIGAGGIWAMWRKGSGETTAVTSRDVDPGQGAGCMVGFFAIFALAGLGFLIPFFVLPGLQLLDARSWTPTPATVEHSRVRTHSGDDGETYSVDILYRYRVGDREYSSNRYDFMSGSSSGYQGKADIVARYPAGSETTALVNPDEPWEAVLSTEFRGEWLFALLPLVFVVVGVGGMAFSLVGAARLRQREARGVEEWMPDDAGTLEAGGGPLVLEPEVGPLGKFLGMTALALFWNGIVGVFVWFWWQGWQESGSPDGCLTLFLVPFVLVGLALLVSVPYQFLAMFNPRPVITLDRRQLTVGSEANLGWRFKGNARRIRHLKIVLEGREEATYTRGTDRHTDKHTFHAENLVDATVGVEQGNASLALPAATMHSFEASNNKIVWVLKLHGTIDRWPDVQDEFPLVIRPREGEA